MKLYKYLLTIILLVFVVQLNAETKNIDENVVKISIQSLIVIGKTKTALGKVTSLSNKAVSAGYDEMMLKGTIKYKRLSNGTTRVTITWSSAKRYSGTSEIKRTLPSSLVSQFTTDNKKVQPNTELSAKGDLDSLAKMMDQLASAQSSTTPGAGDGSEDSGSSKAAASNVSNPSTVANDNIQGDSASGQGDVNSGAEIKLVTYEACSPRIDKVGGKVYQQAAKVTTGSESGTELSRDACSDKGAVADIVQDYSSCGTLEDIASGFVYAKYQEYADLDGSRVQVTNCATDFAKKWTVLTTYEGCAVRHDFINNESIQKEQFYYLDDSNNRVDLGDCLDSSIVYPHSLTLNTCTATVDEINGYVFPQKRVMYTNSIGTVEYATECAPVTSEQVALNVEICPQKYEHDFAAGQSYKRIQKFYNDFQTNEKIIVGACSRDTTISFPHLYEQAGCQTVNDDTLLKTIWNSNTQIDVTSEGDGIMEIAPCQEYGSPTPYAYTGNGIDSVSNGSFRSEYFSTRKTANQWFGVTLTSATVTMQTTGDYACSSAYYHNSSTNYSFGVSTAFAASCNPAAAGWSSSVQALVFMTIDKPYQAYLRGDGTTYKKYISTDGKMRVEFGLGR